MLVPRSAPAAKSCAHRLCRRGRTDHTAELTDTTIADVDVTVEPSSAAATVTSVEHTGDVAAANFTRRQFANLRGDDPGCTVAVGRDGAVVFAEAYGAARLDPFEPMTVDTVVDIGSVSKQFTATAILLLAERGEVDLDVPLSTYLPDLPAWASQTTVAQLIHHQSGIPDYIELLVERGFTVTESSPTIADALAAFSDVRDLLFAPGARWEYSNSNYFLSSQLSWQQPVTIWRVSDRGGVRTARSRHGDGPDRCDRGQGGLL